MIHTYSEIIENQKTFKKEIVEYIKNEIIEAKRELKSINTEDKFITKEKKKMLKRLKSIKIETTTNHFFFLGTGSSKDYYCFWDVISEEVKFYQYPKL